MVSFVGVVLRRRIMTGGAVEPQDQTRRACTPSADRALFACAFAKILKGFARSFLQRLMSVIVVVMGVAGSGKTTIGKMLADAIPCAFLEGDSLHSRANVEKMSQGIPLTDTDRAPWLSAIHARMADLYGRGGSLVVGCSALKQSYRTALAQGLPVTWVYLKGSPQLIQPRILSRAGHFMKAEMLASQFEALEEPSDALILDVSQPPDAIVQQILSRLRRTAGAHDANEPT